MALLKSTASPAKAVDFSHLLTTGAVAGLVVGFPFILANMIYATSQSALPVPKGLNPWFGQITHLGFGLLLVPFFLTTMSRSAR